MKTLVTYYSRSGNTKKVAEKIAKLMKADIDEIIDLKKRSGIIGWLMGGKDATQRNHSPIKNKINPEKYGLVIIGTPIWAWTMTPAVRAYLKKYNLKGKKPKLGFFCTCGGQSGKCFREMEEASKKPLAVLELLDRKLDSPEAQKSIRDFCGRLR